MVFLEAMFKEGYIRKECEFSASPATVSQTLFWVGVGVDILQKLRRSGSTSSMKLASKPKIDKTLCGSQMYENTER